MNRVRSGLLVVLVLSLSGCGDSPEKPGGGPDAAKTVDAPRAERTILVTGFGPFLNVTENPSWEAIRELDGKIVGPFRVRTARLDVTYLDAPKQLQTAMDRVSPELVLCLGVAPGAAIRLESVARNRDTARAPDAAGVIRTDQAVRDAGPATISTRLPLERIRGALAAGGFETIESDDAGGYLCNHLFYELLWRRPQGIAGFVHVPTIAPPWDLPRLRRAVVAIIESLGT